MSNPTPRLYWEKCSRTDYHRSYRAAVPGGWLYRVTEGEAVALVFVPVPSTQDAATKPEQVAERDRASWIAGRNAIIEAIRNGSTFSEAFDLRSVAPPPDLSATLTAQLRERS